MVVRGYLPSYCTLIVLGEGRLEVLRGSVRLKERSWSVALELYTQAYGGRLEKRMVLNLRRKVT